MIIDPIIHINKPKKTILFGRTDIGPFNGMIVLAISFIIGVVWNEISNFALFSYQSLIVCAILFYGLIFNFAFLIIITPKRLKFFDFGLFTPMLKVNKSIDCIEVKPTSEFKIEKNKVYFYYEKECFEDQKSTVAILYKSSSGDGFGTDKNSLKIYNIIEQSIEKMKKIAS